MRRRIVGHDLEHEAIELGLGQIVGPFGLDRVLRGQHQERPLELVAGPLDRDAIFLHDLQQRRVRLGRRAVDFVGQQELREDRPGTKAEFLRLHVEDRRTGDVRGHQVGRELDPAELAAEHAAERADEERLAQAGHAFDQHVAAGKQRHERAEHQLVLADVDLADLGRDPIEQRLGRRHGFGRRHVRKLAERQRVANRLLCWSSAFRRWRPA